MLSRKRIEKHVEVWSQALKNTLKIDTTLAAAGIAFFALFSLFPLILLIVAISSLWFEPLWVEGKLITQLEFIIPGLSDLLGKNFERIIKARRSVSNIASLVLIWSGSTLFSIMARALDAVWSSREVRTGWRYRGMALLFVIVLSIVVLPTIFIATTIVPIIDHFLPTFVSQAYSLFAPFVSIIVSSVLFGLLYRYVPHHRPTWKEVRLGAITCGILWELAKRGFLIYTSRYLSTSNLVYGSFSTIIAFLLWVYLSGIIFFFGAQLGARYSLWTERSLASLVEPASR
jgi:YihY family inner membrane protein